MRVSRLFQPRQPRVLNNSSMAALARLRVICKCHTATAMNSSRVPSVLTKYRCLRTGQCVQAGKKWRESQGQSQSGYEYGPLVDLPDWEYADGRPAPMGSGQYTRQQEQRQIAERIDRLASEMMAAIQKEKDAQTAEQRRQQEIDQHKLKPKGAALKKKALRTKDPVL
ncbi:39S ribosomal protein L52, mitochondrial-like [Acanthaster planci]|uniref:Large ribosomal subunit protein mL52 n=1 Tax=Acanthaster planci TaxID=133434 RepID=A0A8B7XQ93_ACAPL|nr:39S ribosomal protein L52, mitochondrial-like [Acanthaster planci]